MVARDIAILGSAFVQEDSERGWGEKNKKKWKKKIGDGTKRKRKERRIKITRGEGLHFGV
jgi:hypothetical protein